MLRNYIIIGVLLVIAAILGHAPPELGEGHHHHVVQHAALGVVLGYWAFATLARWMGARDYKKVTIAAATTAAAAVAFYRGVRVGKTGATFLLNAPFSAAEEAQLPRAADDDLGPVPAPEAPLRRPPPRCRRLRVA